MTQPVPAKVNRALAEVAVDAFLADERWAALIGEYSWELTRVDDVTLLCAMRARPLPGEDPAGERYVVRLTCEYYPAYPPDARFVNPATGTYAYPHDVSALPILESPGCWVHHQYPSYPPEYPYGPQLVCSSMTFGYYFSGHTPTEDQRWRPGRHDIGSTLWTIYRALQSEHYKGRRTG